MTNKNSHRVGGQNEQKIHPVHYIREQVEKGAFSKEKPLTGKSKTSRRKRKLEQEKLLKAIMFINALKHLLVITYRFTCENVSYYKCAMKHILFWISGTPPNLVMDYSKVLVCSGKRFNTVRAVAKPAGETIMYKWENDLLPKEYDTDKTILVVYCEALNKCIFTTTGPPRNAYKAKLEVAAFRGQTVHTWLSFISADGKEVSDSIYTGKLIMDR